MKLSNLRQIGRYKNQTDGRCVNIHKGRGKDGYDWYFYISSGKRIIIPVCELGHL